jgi:NAD(P)-dependent dehydrogenase (short-subunit alcohol dehydrogenase family)
MNNEPTIAELFSLAGKTVLITGATGWLGSAMSRALAEAGASVVITSRDQDKARAAADNLFAGDNVRHHGIALDHMRADSLESSFSDAVAAAGKIDVLVNNGHEGDAHDLTNVNAEQFTRQLANSTGYFLLARIMRDHLVKRGVGGSIIQLGSMYGQVGSYPDAYEGVSPASSVAYHCLKGGILQLTRHLAVYWARDHIRVNSLSPGPFPSPQAPRAMVERLCKKPPMNRIGQPYELKGAIVFLASEASSYMTGQNLVIDGGWTAW